MSSRVAGWVTPLNLRCGPDLSQWGSESPPLAAGPPSACCTQCLPLWRCILYSVLSVVIHTDCCCWWHCLFTSTALSCLLTSVSHLVWVLSYHVSRGGLSCVLFMCQCVSVFSFVIMYRLSVSLCVHMDRPLFIVTASCVSALHYTDDAFMSLYSSPLCVCVHRFPLFHFFPACYFRAWN